MSDKTMFVLIGEMAGDYDDFYQRYREAVAVSESREALEDFQEWLQSPKAAEEDWPNYVEFEIEEVPLIREVRRPSGKGTPWGQVTQ